MLRQAKFVDSEFLIEFLIFCVPEHISAKKSNQLGETENFYKNLRSVLKKMLVISAFAVPEKSELRILALRWLLNFLVFCPQDHFSSKSIFFHYTKPVFLSFREKN